MGSGAGARLGWPVPEGPAPPPAEGACDMPSTPRRGAADGAYGDGPTGLVRASPATRSVQAAQARCAVSDGALAGTGGQACTQRAEDGSINVHRMRGGPQRACFRAGDWKAWQRFSNVEHRGPGSSSFVVFYFFFFGAGCSGAGRPASGSYMASRPAAAYLERQSRDIQGP